MNKPGDVRNILFNLVGGVSVAAGMLLVAFLLFNFWGASDAAAYRQQHCILVFGHWLAMDRPANVYCQ